MTDSVLTTTKKILGLDAGYTAFDLDVITHINSALSILHQLGIGPTDGFTLVDDTTTWDEIMVIDDDVPNPLLNMLKTYVYLRVRMYFDPPTTSYLITATEKQLTELEWRLGVVRESIAWTPPPVDEDESTLQDPVVFTTPVVKVQTTAAIKPRRTTKTSAKTPLGRTSS
jgi:hypothetical protein